MNLPALERFASRTPARDNALLQELQRSIVTTTALRVGTARPFAHPWKVSAQRFTPPESYAGPLNSENAWRIEVAAGTVNDVVPSILYRRRADPRGWVPPEDYVAPVKGEADYDPDWIERFADDDPEDPPCLIRRDPPRGEKSAPDWTFVEDDDRPEAFQSESDWERELWTASIILSASPLHAGLFLVEVPPRLARYRIYPVAKLPAPAWGAQAGGWRELATLYLLRDPQSPETAEIQIRQREWWPLRSTIVQPGAGLLDLIQAPTIGNTGLPLADTFIAGTNEVNQFFADEARAQIEDLLQGASSVEWWTV